MPAPFGPLIAPPVCLFTLTWAGKTWRLSSEPVDVQDAAGTWHHYLGGLPPQDVTQEVGFLEVGEPQTWEGEVVLPASVATLVEQGHPLQGSKITLALWRRGDRLERAITTFSGRVSSATWGGTNYPTTLRAESEEDVRTVFPDPGWEINDNTWATYRAADRHRVYPTVFGFPGWNVIDGYASAWAPPDPVNAPATPAYYVGVNWTQIDQSIRSSPSWAASRGSLLFANGDRNIVARGIRVWNLTTLAWDDMYVYRAFDNLGNPAWICNLVGGAISPNITDDFAVSWNPADPSDAGNFQPYGGITSTRDEDRAARGAGEILRWALERSGEAVDWRRVGAIRRHLDRFILAGFWDRPCAPWEWVRDNLLPILPLSVFRGPEGITPILWRWWATADIVPRELEDGRNCSFGPEVQDEGGEETYGSVDVSFCPSIGGGAKYRRTYSAGLDSIGTRVNDLTRRGGYRDATPRALDVSTDVVFDHATASLIARWNLAARAQGRKVYTIQADYRSADIELGDVIRLVSAKHALANAVGHVRRVTWKGTAAVEIEVMVFRGVP